MPESIICLTEVSLLWYSTSFPLLCFRRVAFRRVFRPLISASCFRRVVFGELFSTSFPRFACHRMFSQIVQKTKKATSIEFANILIFLLLQLWSLEFQTKICVLVFEI